MVLLFESDELSKAFLPKKITVQPLSVTEEAKLCHIISFVK
jgi:hypothetical protein